MRTERTPSLDYPQERDPQLQCEHTIKLGSTKYGCRRRLWHYGAHDAFGKHTDGGIVRW